MLIRKTSWILNDFIKQWRHFNLNFQPLKASCSTDTNNAPPSTKHSASRCTIKQRATPPTRVARQKMLCLALCTSILIRQFFSPFVAFPFCDCIMDAVSLRASRMLHNKKFNERRERWFFGYFPCSSLQAFPLRAFISFLLDGCKCFRAS